MSNSTTKRRSAHRHTALEKCQAVLSVWSERRTTTQVCRDMKVSWTVLNSWQDLALEGMLRALEPKKQTGPDKADVLSARLRKRLEKKARLAGPVRLRSPAADPPEADSAS